MPVEKLERAAAEVAAVSGLSGRWGLVHTGKNPAWGFAHVMRTLGDLVHPTVVDTISPLGSPRLSPGTVLCQLQTHSLPLTALTSTVNSGFLFCLVHSQVSTPQAATATFTSHSLPTARLSVTIAWFFSLNPHIQHSIHQHVLLFLSPHPLTHIY